MRSKKDVKQIKVEQCVHDRLKEDKKAFQKSIGGGKWSLSDTIKEYYKILDSYSGEDKTTNKKIKKKSKIKNNK